MGKSTAMALNRIEWALWAKGYPMQQARRDMAALHGLSADEFQRWRQQRRWEMVRHHFENNTAYRRLFTGQKLPEKWEDLPVIQKKHLQDELETLLSRPYRRAQVHIGSTSGSSGHPFFYAKDKYAHAMTYALIAERYGRHGLAPGQKQARFYGIPLEGHSARMERWKDRIAGRTRFPVFDLSEQKLAVYLEAFSRKNFEQIYGYASVLVQFALFLKRQKVVLTAICPALRACITTSEMCSPADMDLLREVFGVPVLNEYGASELDVIAFPDKQGNWILSEENLYIEVLDEDNRTLAPGREGRIIVTALHNRAFPMLRYELGDLGAIAEGRLLQLSGRSNDLILLPGGKVAAGLTFYYIARQLLESGEGLREFIIRQTAPDTFELDVVSSSPLQSAQTAQIQAAMDLYLEKNLRLVIHPVERIERPASGKIRHFYRQFS